MTSTIDPMLALDDLSPVVQPCPAWGCDQQPGHPWDSTTFDGLRHVRIHSKDFGRAAVVVEESVAASNKSGPTTLGKPEVQVYLDEGAGYTLDAAITLAADLLTAASFLQTVLGSTR